MNPLFDKNYDTREYVWYDEYMDELMVGDYKFHKSIVWFNQYLPTLIYLGWL